MHLGNCLYALIGRSRAVTSIHLLIATVKGKKEEINIYAFVWFILFYSHLF